MMMSKLQKQITFSVYLLITVAMLIYVSIEYWIPLNPHDYTNLLIYLIFLVIINSFPVKVGNTYITFILAISIIIFLQYGIVVETWLVQVALLISLLISDSKRSIKHLVLTLLMFIWISIISASVFFLAGGTLGFNISELKYQLIPIFLYAITYFFVNNIIMFIFQRLTMDKDIKFFSEDIIWDAVSLLFTLPFGVLMYIAKQTFGNFPMLIIASQFILFTFLFRFYNQLHQSHQQIKTLNQLITTYTSELDLGKTISALQQALREVLSFDYSNIYIMKGNKMNLISSEDNSGNMLVNPLKENECFFDKKMMDKVILTKKTFLINDDAEIFSYENRVNCAKGCKSFLSVPMIWRDTIIGILNFASLSESNFSQNDTKIVNILASQAGLAIKNATTFQRIEEKSLIDELTGLYNFRAFSNYLNDRLDDAEIKDRNISLLMIDIDYFKKVNDNYGHQTGNEVLKEIANLLKELTRKEDIVSRYGGEEFTVIIPDANHIRAIEIAERIRSTIENHIIEIRESINENKQVSIKITVSIGLSTYPDPATSANDLIRFSDRALYVGSKMKGRNKVSVYKEGKIEDIK